MAGTKTATSSEASQGIGLNEQITKAQEHRILAISLLFTCPGEINDDVQAVLMRMISELPTKGASDINGHSKNLYTLMSYQTRIPYHLESYGYDTTYFRRNIYSAFVALYKHADIAPVSMEQIKSFIGFMLDSIFLVAPAGSDAAKYLAQEYSSNNVLVSPPPFLPTGEVNVPKSRAEAQARGCTHDVNRFIRDNYVTALEEAFLYIAYSMLKEALSSSKKSYKDDEINLKFFAVIGYFMTPQGEVTRHTFNADSIDKLKERMGIEFGVKLRQSFSPAIVQVVANEDIELKPLVLTEYAFTTELNVLSELYRADLFAKDFDLHDYPMPPEIDLFDVDDDDESDYDDDDESDYDDDDESDYDDDDESDYDDDDESDYDDEDSDSQPSASHLHQLPAAFNELFNHVMSDIPIESEAECAELMQVLLIRVMALQIEDPSVSDLTVAQLKQRLGFGKATGANLKQLLLEESFNTIKLIDVPEIGQKYQDLCKRLELHFKKCNLKRDYKSVNIRPSTISTLLMVNNTYEHLVGTQRVQRIYFVSGDTHIELEPILSNELNREAEVMLANFVLANLDTILSSGSSKLEDNLPSLDLNSEGSKNKVTFSLLEDEDDDIGAQDAMAKVKDKEAFAKDLALTKSTKLIAFPKNITQAKTRIAAFKRRFGRGVTTSDNALENFIFEELNKLKAEVKAATDAPKQKDASLYEKKVQMALASWLTDDGSLQDDLATDTMRQAIADYIEDAQWCILPVNTVALEYANALVDKDLTARSICAYKANGQVNPCACPDEAEVRMEAHKRHVFKSTDRISDEQLDIMRLLNIHADLKDQVRPMGLGLLSQIRDQTCALAELLTPRGEINKDCFTKEKYQRVRDETVAMARSFSKYDEELTPVIEDILKWDPSPFSYDYEENRPTQEDIEAIQRMQSLQHYAHYHSVSSRERKVLAIMQQISIINDDIKRYSRKVFFDCCLECAHRISAFIEPDGSVINSFSNKHNRELDAMVMKFVTILKDLISDPDKARYKYY